MVNSVIRFFDLYSQYRTTEAKAQGVGKDDIAGWRQVVIYLACALGIVLGPHVAAAAAGTFPPFSVIFDSFARIFWAIIFGFVLTALLFKVLVKPTTPLVIQIGVALAAGFSSARLIPVAVRLLTRH